jgi:hypothetical protein
MACRTTRTPVILLLVARGETRAQAARLSPDLYRQLGRDPAKVIEEGNAAMRARFEAQSATLARHRHQRASALLRSAKAAPNVLPKAIPSDANSRAESLSRPRHGGSCERHR